MGNFEKAKEYFRNIGLGVRNFHFFRIGKLPSLLASLSELEKKLLLAALAVLVVSGGFLISQSYLNSTVPVPDFGGKYTEGLVGQPRFINPVLSPANNVDMDLSRIVYSGLLKFNNQQQLVPDLAESMPELSGDQKQYTIKLRQDVLWHDGKPFTADDVIFTIKLIQDQSFQSPLRLNWNKVEVQKIDDYTVILKLKEPSAPFLTNLTQGILPKHIWEGVEAAKFPLSKYNLQPIGTGPFMVKDLKKSEDGEIKSITLTAFEQYFLGRPYLDSLEFKFYKSYDELIASYHSKEIAGLGYIPFDKKVYVEKSSRINIFLLQLPQYQALFFNRNKSKVLADKNVRAALAQSISRQEIIDEVYSGAASEARGPIPPGYLGYNPGVEQAHLYNIENAKKLLADTGFKPVEGSSVLRKGEVDLEFTITTNDFPLNIKTAEILKRQWEAIGFRINLNILTIGELEQNFLRPRQYEALLFSENIGPDPDLFAFWHSSQRQDPGLNLAMFSNREADKLLEEARSNSDPKFREPRYRRFQEILVEEVPAIFIVKSTYVYGVNTKIKGINLTNIVNQSERFLDVNKWYINTRRTFKR